MCLVMVSTTVRIEGYLCNLCNSRPFEYTVYIVYHSYSGHTVRQMIMPTESLHHTPYHSVWHTLRPQHTRATVHCCTLVYEAVQGIRHCQQPDSIRGALIDQLRSLYSALFQQQNTRTYTVKVSMSLNVTLSLNLAN